MKLKIVYPPLELHTPRLYLRQWQPADLEPFAQMNADPQVMEFFPHPLTRQASDDLAYTLMKNIAQQGWDCWALELKSDCSFMGFVGLHCPTVPLPFAPCVEVGWRLAQRYWGQGYATEAAREALRVGFEVLELEEIVSFTALLNVRSQAVMQRLGMHRDAATFEHPNLPVGHALREHCLYRLARQSLVGRISAT